MSFARDGREDKYVAPYGRGGESAERTVVVLVGLDGSDTSWAAFYWACGESRRVGGRIVAVFVTPDFVCLGADVAIPGAPLTEYEATGNVADRHAAQLRAEALQNSAGLGVDLTFIHLCGDTAAEILGIAKAVHADQIVVGRSTKRRHRFAGALGRRLATKRDAPIVVIVP